MGVDSAAGDREDLLTPHAPTWTLERGATVLADGRGTRFSLWAPYARRVEVVIHDGAMAGRHALERGANDVFERTLRGVGAGIDYAYSLDGGPERADPVSRWQPFGVHGPSRVVDPTAFRWTDAGWSGLAMADYVIYELHVGTFTDAGTFDAAIEHLPALAHLGVSAIELMPVAQFPGARNWGYDGVLPYAPQDSYGGPDGLKRLVNAAHEHGLAVVLDVVYNHLGPEGCILAEFGPYFSIERDTPWGAAFDCDGPARSEVRRYIIDNALYWVSEYHIDALRLDAVRWVHDSGRRHVLAELAERVHTRGAQLGRRVQVIAESCRYMPRLVRAPARGGLGLDAEWRDDFHHAVHVALTGERRGYYAGNTGIPHIARALERGGAETDAHGDRYVIYVQNHDQVGNRAHGERLAALVPLERRKLAAALLLLVPRVPLLFMGEEYGEMHPFLFFVSYGDPALADATRVGRTREFAAFRWKGDIADPQAEETFARSKLDRATASLPENRCLLALYRDLLALRRAEPALRPGHVMVRARCSAEDEWLALELTPARGAGLVALFNFSPHAREVMMPADADAHWRLRFSTRNARYGGPSDTPRIAHRRSTGETQVTLPPESAALYRREEH